LGNLEGLEDQDYLDRQRDFIIYELVFILRNYSNQFFILAFNFIWNKFSKNRFSFNRKCMLYQLLLWV